MLAGALGGAVAASSFAGTTTYTYDVHSRLTVVSSQNGADQAVTTYTLDSAGNRQALAVTLFDSTSPNPPTNPTATAMGYDTIRLSWTTSLDANGGPVGRGLAAAGAGTGVDVALAAGYVSAGEVGFFEIAASGETASAVLNTSYLVGLGYGAPTGGAIAALRTPMLTSCDIVEVQNYLATHE
jgi:hypothetical protein